MGRVGEHWEPVSSIVAARRAEGGGDGEPSAQTRREARRAAPGDLAAADGGGAAPQRSALSGRHIDKLMAALMPKPLDPNNWSGSNKQVAYTIRNAPGANIYMTASGMGSATA